MTFRATLVRRLILPGLFLAVGCAVTIWGAGFPSRFDARIAEFEKALQARPEILRKGCHVPSVLYGTEPDSQRCRLGADKSQLDGVLIGDSYANHYSGLVDELAREQGLAFMDYTMDACPPIRGYRPVGNEQQAERCVRRNERAYSFLAASGIKRVILAANWPEDPAAGNKLVESLKFLGEAGISVTLIHKNQAIPQGQSCPIRQILFGKGGNCGVAMDAPVPYLATLKADFPLLRWLQPNDVICSQGDCQPAYGDVLLYRDGGHLNDLGARWIAARLREEGSHL